LFGEHLRCLKKSGIAPQGGLASKNPTIRKITMEVKGVDSNNKMSEEETRVLGESRNQWPRPGSPGAFAEHLRRRGIEQSNLSKDPSKRWLELFPGMNPVESGNTITQFTGSRVSTLVGE